MLNFSGCFCDVFKFVNTSPKRTNLFGQHSLSSLNGFKEGVANRANTRTCNGPDRYV